MHLKHKQNMTWQRIMCMPILEVWQLKKAYKISDYEAQIFKLSKPMF